MSKYPLAGRMTPVNASAAAECIHCRNAIVVSRWDKLNGFLVECPSCRGYHGRRWSARAVGAASLVLNGISFFFTMRPSRAFIALFVWATAIFFLLPKTEYAADWIQASAFIIVFLAPMIINMALLVRHQIDLDRHPLAARAS